MEDSVTDKIVLERATSVNLEERRPKTGIISKWKSFRLSKQSEDWTLPEEFDLPREEDELSIQICKDTIRTSLFDGMRASGGDVKVLLDIEDGKQFPIIAMNQTCLSITLLWSCMSRRHDLLAELCMRGATLDYTLPGERFSCIHLAAFSGCSNCIKWLINQGIDVNLTLDKYSPLHYAVLGNSTDAVKLLLSSGAKLEDVMVHSAVRANALECLRILLARGCSPNSIDSSGFAPIHIAADRGLPQALKILLNSPKINVNITTREKSNTALHLSSDGANIDCITLLLEKGASVKLKNSKGEIPLHLACKSQYVECIEALLKAGSDVNSCDCDNRTPLHSAVGKASQEHLAVEVLLRWGADINKQDRYGYTPLHIASVNELSQIVDALILAGADVSAKTRGGLTALSIISRKTPASLSTIEKKLDSSLTMNEPEHTNRELELKLDFRYLLQHSSGGEMGLLKTLINAGQKDLLQHPLCSAFLYIKWLKIRIFYFSRLFLTGLFVLHLTLYVMTALAHNCYNFARNRTTTDQELCQNNSLLAGLVLDYPLYVEILWCLMVILSIAETVRKCMAIAGYTSVKQYFLQWANLIEWFTIISVYIISYIYTGRTYVWQNHIGAFSVLCGWTNLMVMIGQLPVFGTYVAMFTKVQAEFAKLLLAYACLLIGFTISFYVIFPTSQAFQNPIIGFMKVLVMMTGELDLDLLLGSKRDKFPLDISAHITFFLFILFVTVVLMNLLVGIAVHDIGGLSRTAGLNKLVRQTELISFLEVSLFKGYLPNSVMKVVRRVALVAPQAYRVVLHVRPLNPQETRLPRDVMKAALEIARKTRGGLCSTPSLRYTKASSENIAQRLERIETILEQQMALLNNVISSIKKSP